MSTTTPGSKLIKFLGSLLGTGGTDRFLHDKLSEQISVKDFGATGNGSTDDTAAIQAAINYVTASPITTTIFFPSGTYIVSRTLTITKNGLRLKGAGAGGYHDNSPQIFANTYFRWAGTAGGTCVKISPEIASQYVSSNGIEGIFFDGNNGLGGIAVNLVACRYGEYDIRACHWTTSFVQMDPGSTSGENGTCTGNYFKTIAGYQSNSTDGAFLICNSNSSYNCCWNTYQLIQGNWNAHPMVILNGNDNEKFMTINGYNPNANTSVYGVICNGGPNGLQATRHLTFYHLSTTALGGAGIFIQGTNQATVAAFGINILYYDIDNLQGNPVIGPGAAAWWSTNNAPSGKQAFFFASSPTGYQEIDNSGKIKIA